MLFGFEPYISSQVTLKEKELKVLRESVEAASIRTRAWGGAPWHDKGTVGSRGGGPLTSWRVFRGKSLAWRIARICTVSANKDSLRSFEAVVCGNTPFVSTPQRMTAFPVASTTSMAPARGQTVLQCARRLAWSDGGGAGAWPVAIWYAHDISRNTRHHDVSWYIRKILNYCGIAITTLQILEGKIPYKAITRGRGRGRQTARARQHWLHFTRIIAICSRNIKNSSVVFQRETRRHFQWVFPLGL